LWKKKKFNQQMRHMGLLGKGTVAFVVQFKRYVSVGLGRWLYTMSTEMNDEAETNIELDTTGSFRTSLKLG